MVVIGSDSHTCSSGAVGCLAIGLGAADVTLPLVTGETWFKVPECINIRLVGTPRPGIGGKDVILYILQQLKRNTVASDRIVEFTGPGVRHLSSDARFAICNMTTVCREYSVWYDPDWKELIIIFMQEFGGVTGIFVPDQITQRFVQKRRLQRHKNLTTYFKPDNDAVYAAAHEIDLGNVRSFLARYPNPDDVVPVQDCEGMKLDGCFIGACTTGEEDLILAALVLEQGLREGRRLGKGGVRKVVPGSLPILHKLRKLGLMKVYENAGFEVGVPGCSYCVGMSADQASPGEIWLSSQNRNFENRMGKGKEGLRILPWLHMTDQTGSIGHLASAATVAASSFDMRVTDPHELLAAIDLKTCKEINGVEPSQENFEHDGLKYVEPCGPLHPSPLTLQRNVKSGGIALPPSHQRRAEHVATDIVAGKVQRLGDFIDTDAV